MANRPGKLCELEKGKLIDTQQGFADTFNFAVKAIDNLSGGKNCEVDWTIPDHPVINVDIPETESGGGGGGGGGGNVEDVSSETYQGGESFKVEYADGSADGHIPLSFVKDVSSETYQGGPAIKVDYSNGDQSAHIPLPSSSGGNVDNVTSETYNNGESIKVEYADGSTDGHIPLSFVKDVSSETHNNGESLKVEHSDGSADTHIPLSFVKDVSSETYQGSPSIKVEYSNGNADGHIPLPSVSTDTVDVITGISFSFDSNTNELKATLTKKRLTIISKSDLSDGTAGLKIWKHDVVISSEYSTQNHQFKNKLTSGVVTNQTIDTSTTHDSSPVFTATAHSNE